MKWFVIIAIIKDTKGSQMTAFCRTLYNLKSHIFEISAYPLTVRGMFNVHWFYVTLIFATVTIYIGQYLEDNE